MRLGGGRGFVYETPGVGEGLFMRLRGWERVCSMFIRLRGGRGFVHETRGGGGGGGGGRFCS